MKDYRRFLGGISEMHASRGGTILADAACDYWDNQLGQPGARCPDFVLSSSFV